MVQYPTSAHLAAAVVTSIERDFGDIAGRIVGDLGCGCGILSAAAALTGAAAVVGYEIDPKAIVQAQRNFEELEIHVDLVCMDVLALVPDAELVGDEPRAGRGRARGRGRPGRGGKPSRSAARQLAGPSGVSRGRAPRDAITRRPGSLRGDRDDGTDDDEDEEDEEDEDDENGGGGGGEQRERELDGRVAPASDDARSANPPLAGPPRSLVPSKLFDTVVMNPPFGTRRPGIDLVFVQAALRLTGGGPVYSLHKSSTREGVVKRAAQWGVTARPVAQLRFDIPRMYKFHKKDSADVDVDLVRFVRQDEGDR